ncbi:MAG TPA: hypothetical protein VMZ26_10770 [Pyrinomonadaceae bacterium]|nr:hypothetical protein [Pyrinomonadaceae bacterium]
MKGLSFIFLLTLAFACGAFGQTFNDTVAKVRQINLLVSTRDDVKRILRGYDASDDKGHSQTFSNENLRIEVTYSTGICTDDSGEEDASEIWALKEWIVTRMEIEPDEPISIQKGGLKFATFKKEPRFPDDADSLVFHDKAAGTAVKTTAEGIGNVIFFPPRINSNKLCRNAVAARGFYTRKGWFPHDRPYDYACVLINQHANVHDMNLSAVELEVTSNLIVSVSTAAVDPENDVLTYNYKVTAGKIVGTGAMVGWDLTGVAPGTYSITAGVDDGAGIVGKTVTKSVTIR